ncbi:MAG: 4Fe-4S binding protein [Terracidiphilus sp.]|nr:4Fe-4S binding protein [Terracidiphilus sp.]MDR3775716.1 4Fe-4S binding protein [Terracidiphilus sp.]
MAATHHVLLYALAALFPLALTLLIGRFFCGWMCPFGAIHEFITWITGKRQMPGSRPDRKLLRIKYLILAAVIAAALAGTTLGGWLDPFALLTRSVSAGLEPTVYSYATQGEGVRVAVQPVLIGMILLAVILLNAWKRRFFCNVLCPLGALYGLFSRFSWMRLEAAGACTGCRKCTARCTYNGGPSSEQLKSECNLCFACVADCQKECVQIRFASPAGTEARLDFGRRRLLGATAVGLGVAAFSHASAEAQPRSKAKHSFLRPPGAVNEKQFLAECLRCGQCVEACPTNFIQPSFLEGGFQGLWTPVLNARTGYCSYECNLCTQVCPTGAIEPLAKTRKQALKIGTATFNRNRCLRSVEGSVCSVCLDMCPVPGKAIRVRTASQPLLEPRDRVNELFVVADLCTGCGICEHFCAVEAEPGIAVSAENEDREAMAMI